MQKQTRLNPWNSRHFTPEKRVDYDFLQETIMQFVVTKLKSKPDKSFKSVLQHSGTQRECAKVPFPHTAEQPISASSNSTEGGRVKHQRSDQLTRYFIAVSALSAVPHTGDAALSTTNSTPHLEARVITGRPQRPGHPAT